VHVQHLPSTTQVHRQNKLHFRQNKNFFKALFTTGEYAVGGYKGAADDSPPSSLFVEAMTARFSA
jgi:hypothetical protein